MGILPDLIKLNIRSHFSVFLDLVEAVLVDDRGMMVFRFYCFICFISDPLCCRILRGDRLPIDRGSCILLIGEDFSDGTESPSSFPSGTRDAWGFQLPLDPHNTPALFIDDKILILITIIPIVWSGEGRGVRIDGASFDAPFDIGAFVLTFSLCKCGMEGQYEFAWFLGKEDVLILKIDVHPTLLPISIRMVVRLSRCFWQSVCNRIDDNHTT